MKTICKDSALFSLDGPEVCREYFRSGKMWFGTSELLPGQTGGIDPGHPVSQEIFYLARGHAAIRNPASGAFYELHAGDALLIEEGEPHEITNIGTKPVCIVWAGGPGK